MRTNAALNIAETAAILMSEASARANPPPDAGPLTAAITGCRKLRSLGQCRDGLLDVQPRLRRVVGRSWPARGLKPTAEQVTACADTGQLDAWFDRALTATSAAQVFQD
jgi:hypothetical protein